MTESLEALRRANPRGETRFDTLVDDTRGAVDAWIASDAQPVRHLRQEPRRRLVRTSVVGIAVAIAAVVAVSLTIGSPGRGPGVEDAAAAVKRAATRTAASAEESGIAVVRMTHDGRLWAGKTVRWNGSDVSIARQEPDRQGKVGSEWLLVDGVLYGFDPREGGWLELGPPESIDPGSGTTPIEILAAVREDVGGATLRRVTGAMAGLTAHQPGDGTTVYRGTVAAGQVARETGFKEGQAIRVLPFGYVAHDAAADPASPLDIAVTVGADGVVREIAVTWGTWTYTVSYSGLGATPAPVAPENAKSLRELRHPAA